MKNDFFLKIALIGIAFLFIPDLFAQCPMCKMAAESNMKSGGTAGAGLNFGILYMFVLPYLLVGSIGFIWWRNRNKEVDDMPKSADDDLGFSEN